MKLKLWRPNPSCVRLRRLGIEKKSFGLKGPESIGLRPGIEIQNSVTQLLFSLGIETKCLESGMMVKTG